MAGNEKIRVANTNVENLERDERISILHLTTVSGPSYAPISISKFRSVPRILDAACLRP